MDRAVLERLTVKQLRHEAANYRLPTTDRKIDLIETIIAHLETNGPVSDLLGSSQEQLESEAEAGPVRPADRTDQADLLRQMVNALQGVIQRQNEDRQVQQRQFF